MTSIEPDAAVLDAVRNAESVTVLTGAGMSAESGVPTFRGAQTGLWARFDPEELASPDAFTRDPDLVWRWYRWRAALVAASEPNAGHRALARWQQSEQGVRIATQNVDDLHERAGSEVVAHVHGTLAAVRCSICDHPYTGPLSDDEIDPEELRSPPPLCAECGSPVRPGVVWFGESLPQDQWEAVVAAVDASSVVLVVGTSGVVYPFAGLPAMARGAGATVIEINPEETAVSDMAHHCWRASAASALPALVDAVGVAR